MRATQAPVKAATKGIPNAEVQRLADTAMIAWETQRLATEVDSTGAWWLFAPTTVQDRASLEIVRCERGPADPAMQPIDLPPEVQPPLVHDDELVWKATRARMEQAALGATETASVELASRILALSAPP